MFYLRMGYKRFLLCYLPQLSTLHIATKSENFGAGTFIQHGFATIIFADHIGRNCWINQQVTIGASSSNTLGYGLPWIGDNVRISAGAKVVGPVKIGNDSVIGVNASVIKNVPEGSTVIPSPMMMIREGYEKVYKKL